MELKTPRERVDDLISLLVSDWRPTPRQRLWAMRIAIVLGVFVAIGYAYDITLWDWAKLLIVPAAIAFAGLWFNAQQSDRERKCANEHARARANEWEHGQHPVAKSFRNHNVLL